MESIKCAAIQYELLKEPGVIKYISGDNHSQCFQYFAMTNIRRADRNMDKEVEGFMTSLNRFVDRGEAYRIAKSTGQLIEEVPYPFLDAHNVKMCCRCVHDTLTNLDSVAACNCCDNWEFFAEGAV